MSEKAVDFREGTRSELGFRRMDWSYYDTHILAAATTQVRFFTQGLAGSTKQLWQTNMKLNGQIPTGEKLEIQRIKLMYCSSADIANTVWTNIFTMFKESTIEVKVGGADSVLTLTLQEAFGDCLLVSTTALAGAIASPNPRFHGVFPLQEIIKYSENETVEVLMTHHVAPNAALNGHWLTISLNGILNRKFG
jgi:hypothetical protein